MLSYTILICVCFAVLNEAAPTTEENLHVNLNKTHNAKEHAQHEKEVTIIKQNLFKPTLSDTSNEGKETSSAEVDSAVENKKKNTKPSLKIDDKPSAKWSPSKITTTKSVSDENSTWSDEITTESTTVANGSYENEVTDFTTVQDIEPSSSTPTSSISPLDSEPANIENLSVNLADGLFI